jgi:hypothetical protein
LNPFSEVKGEQKFGQIALSSLGTEGNHRESFREIARKFLIERKKESQTQQIRD